MNVKNPLSGMFAKRTVAGTSLPVADALVDPPTWADGVKNFFTLSIGTFAPFGITFVLWQSAGYLFSGLHEFSFTDQPTFLAYVGAAILELVVLALIFTAQYAYKNHSRPFFWIAFSFALAFSAMSVVSQYAYLASLTQQGIIHINEKGLTSLPFLASLSTYTLLFWRSVFLQSAELACTFVIAKRKPDAEKLREAQRQRHEDKITSARQEQSLQLEQAANQFTTIMMQNMNTALQKQMQGFLAQINSGTSIQELPEGKPDAITGHLIEVVKAPDPLAQRTQNSNGHLSQEGK